jgi:LPS-assembly protein
MSQRAALAAAVGLLWLAAPLAGQEPVQPAPAPPATPAAAPAAAPAATPPATAPPAATPPATTPPATAAGQPPGTPQPAGPPPRRADRIDFEAPLSADHGGGKVAGEADRLETTAEKDAVLEGDVELRYKDLHFRADHVVIHGATSTLEAEGDVLFDQGPQRILATRVDFDLATRTGTFWNAAASMPNDVNFTGAVVAKTGDQSYEITRGVFTSCTGDPTPDWSLHTSRARVDLGDYAHIRNARMQVKKLPIFYWPYLVWPARTERTSGLLIPNFGYSQRRGAYLGLAYYQVMGPSVDGTLYFDTYSKRYFGLGSELRWRPSEGDKGQAQLYFLRDPDTGQKEWRARFNETADDLPWGLRGVVAFEDYSDYNYFRQFERSELQNTRRFLYSNAFISGNWGAQSLNILADQRQTFLTDGSTTTQRQLPEVNYRLTKLKLGGSKFYLSLDTTASYLESSSSGRYDVGYGRFDLHPEVTLPLSVAPWLSVAASAGGRLTWWGDTVVTQRVDPETGTTTAYCGDTPAAAGQVYCGSTLDRVVPLASLSIIGPSISRVFDHGLGRFAKFKHIVEPRWTWAYAGTFDQQNQAPKFDEIDPLDAANIGQLSLVNRVLAKPTDPDEGGAFEIFSFELAQAYSFDKNQPLQKSIDGTKTSQESGLIARLRYGPTKDFLIQAKVSYATLFPGLDSTSLTAHSGAGRVTVDATWFTNYQPELGTKASDQARLTLGVDVLPNRLRLIGSVNYDLEARQTQQQRYVLSYRSQCWDIQLEAREQVTRTYTSRDYRFLLNLKNVGTFLDLSSGDSYSNF